ncbi:MAG TPA: trehalose-phosphatase [Bacteroidales bacterium]|nr:trehalose-phosphatase [Bacteroidales bacterium]
MKTRDTDNIIAGYRAAANRLVLLDYDGTLVNYELIPSDARLPRHMYDVLQRFIMNPGTRVFVITGRAQTDIEKMLDHLQINIIAEHGSMIREGGIWRNLSSGPCQWKESIIPIMKQAVADCPGSFLEEKKCSVAWHYRNADSRSGIVHSRKLIRNLEETVLSSGLKLLDGNKVVEVLPGDTGKGEAVTMLKDQDNYDYILAIGDDKTDEEMFMNLSDDANAWTIRVGSGRSHAKYGLESTGEVFSLLKRLSG